MKLLVIDVETLALGLTSIDEDFFATIAAEIGLAACKLVGRYETLILATMAIDVLLRIGRLLQQGQLGEGDFGRNLVARHILHRHRHVGLDDLHYRIVIRRIFEKEIKPILKKE